MSVAAVYYDGQTSQQRAVRLYGTGAVLIVEGDGVRRQARLADVSVSEQLGSAPRLIRFADGAFCEVRDGAALATLLGTLGHREGWVERAQRSWRLALGSLALVVALLGLGYVYGLPWAAEQVARRLPPAVDRALAEETLRALEGRFMRPSRLAEDRRREIVTGFRELARPPGTTATARIRFGASGIGPNAFALPDGTVVLLDELVELCDHDEQIYAVLGHELGHVQHRHGTRLLLQGTFVGMVAAWWLGDISGLLAGAPAVLLQARYSRGFEAEADRYAVALLKANGIAPARLAEALEKLVAAHGMSAKDAHWSDFLSTHPAPPERLDALRNG